MMQNYLEVHSPDRLPTLRPRVLTFGLSPDIDHITKRPPLYLEPSVNVSPRKQPTCSPPYRKVRALRLFDTPTTPKTIIQKSSLNKPSSVVPTNSKQPDETEMIFGKSRVPGRISATSSTSSLSSNTSHDRPTALHVHNRALETVYSSAANVNPFSPNSLALRKKKRTRTISQRETGSCRVNDLVGDTTAASSTSATAANTIALTRRSVASLFSNYVDTTTPDVEVNDLVQAPKRLALQDSNISRYEKEFLEIARIGVGEFGYVYHCLNRLDGCDYAIKKSIKPVAGSIFEKTALNEVWAHAVLGKHDNVVRYYSAWAENNHMLIQNEYCNGGSLQNVLQSGRFLNELELRTLLMHIASGLKYIHSNDLVHMDLKAGNIFISKLQTSMSSSNGGSGGGGGGLRASTSSVEYCDDGFEDDLDAGEVVTYKIGDLGHVTSINDPQVEEGDCRYLPNEILREDFTHLCKADIFALGITLYEAGGGGALPKNGAEWHQLRDGHVPDLPRLSREFNELIKLMTHPDPQKRPSSTSIFYHPVLYSAESKSKAQLNHELNVQRQKNEMLMKKLRESALLIKSYEQASTPNQKRGRNSPAAVAAAASDRKLRSFSRRQRSRANGRTRAPPSNATQYRDTNKNVVSDIDFLL